MRRLAPVTALAVLAPLAPIPALAEQDGADETSLFTIDARYTGDGFRNPSGGLQQREAYLDLIELAAGFDAGRALGVSELSAYASLIHTNGSTFTKHVGEAMVVSNIEAVDHPNLFEAWIDWGFEAHGHGSLRLGLYDLNSEFDTGEPRDLFLNSAYGVGQELAQTGEYGPSIYPITSLGARIAWKPADTWELEAVVLDAVPGSPDDIDGSRWRLSRSEGALWAMEVTTAVGPFPQISLGHWRYTAEFPELLPDTPGGAPPSSNDNYGTYVTAGFAPREPRRDGRIGWRGFVRAGLANERINVFERHFAAGIAVDCPWPADAGSEVGLAVADARVSDDYRTLRRSEGDPAAPFERNVELTWRIPLGDHVVLQPDLQFVVNPGGERGVDDAWVIGLRIELYAAR